MSNHSNSTQAAPGGTGSPGRLGGRTAVVTGAGRGLGRAIAVSLAEHGARAIALVARSQAELDEAADAVRAAGAEAHPIAADLSDAGALGALVARIRDAVGDVDILINNAATVEPLGPTLGLDPARVQNALTLNVVVPIALTGLLAPAMVRQGWGRIVNISSGVAVHPTGMIGGGTYAATKAALEAHTTNLAAELDGTGVTVNAYRPGTVDTSMQKWLRTRDADDVGQRLLDTFQAYHDDGKLITPERSAGQLVDHLAGEVTSGEVWSIRR